MCPFSIPFCSTQVELQKESSTLVLLLARLMVSELMLLDSILAYLRLIFKKLFNYAKFQTHEYKENNIMNLSSKFDSYQLFFFFVIPSPAPILTCVYTHVAIIHIKVSNILHCFFPSSTISLLPHLLWQPAVCSLF